MVFDRQAYMRKYYQDNKKKLKQYSSNYKKGLIKSDKSVNLGMEIKRGPIILRFD